MRTTRTHTVYFSEESLTKLIEANAELWVDLDERKPYISEEAYLAAATRLGLLNTAIQLLKEPVADSLT